MNDAPLTKHDLDLAIAELKTFILDRETALIWRVITLQITYFFATLATLWFTLSHYK